MGLLSYLKGTDKVHRAVRTLEHLGTPIRGPFLTPQRNSIYVVDACILTESEIVDLYQTGDRKPELVAKALSEFKRRQLS